MPEYKAPVREIKFVMDEVLDMPGHYASLPAFAENATPEMIDAIVGEGAKFCENVLAPLNRVGDEEGCTRHEDGSVTTPTGFKEAYAQYVEGGWPTLAHDEEVGGQGVEGGVADGALGIIHRRVVMHRTGRIDRAIGQTQNIGR